MRWLGPRRLRSRAGRDEGARHGDLRQRRSATTRGHATPTAGSGVEHRHRGLGGGGNLRAAVFGVNDGLVSNASLILGVAGASPDPHVVLLTGVAGLCAGAFAMAAGEYVSVRSQRELFEYQIGARARRARRNIRKRRRRSSRSSTPRRACRSARRTSSRKQIVADPEHALDTLAREELGLNPGELGSPWGAAIASFLSFAAGAAAAARAVHVRRRARARCRSRSASPASRCSASARCCRSSPAAARGCSGLAHAGAGRARGRRHVRHRPPGRRRARLTRRSPRIALRRRRRRVPRRVRARAEARARQVAAAASSLDLLRRDRRASTATPAVRRHRRRSSPPTARSSRAPPTRRRRRSARASGSFDAGDSDRCRVLRAARRARRRRARADARRARTPACRLIHGESDGLPGVVADRYGDVVVLQCLSAGAERWRDAIVAALVAATGVACVFERSDADVRTLEGLRAAHGRRCAARCRDDVTIRRGRPRLSRRRRSPARRPASISTSATTARSCARSRAGRRVLNVFCYTGGFTLAALAGGAARVRLDRQLGRRARAGAREPRAQPGAAAPTRAEWREADVFAELRRLRDARRDVRPDRARPAEVRADRGARRARGARVQGHQPARAEAAARPAACSRRSRARAASTPSSSRRSSPARRSMPAPTRRSSRTSARAPTIRSR